MFLTLQFPFADVRAFIADPPDTVISKIKEGKPSRLGKEQYKDRYKEGFVRSFGCARPRGYDTEFIDSGESKHLEGTGISEYWDQLSDLWSEESCYFNARHSLLFEKLETHKLLEKLRYPSVKVRSLHFSRHHLKSDLWSPCMRFELGIYYDLTEPLGKDELQKVLLKFLELPTKVPIPKENKSEVKIFFKASGKHKGEIDRKRTNKKNKTYADGPLIEQKNNLANLILKSTTPFSEIQIDQQMVIPGKPLLAVHYFSDELPHPPLNVHWLPEMITEGVKIGYLPLNTQWGAVGIWLFELTSTKKTETTHKEIVNQRVIIRNYTIAIMRYWSEFQAAHLITTSLSSKKFGLSPTNNSLLQTYLTKATDFIFTPKWHSARLKIIRNVINAYEDTIDDNEQRNLDNAIRGFNLQLQKKLLQLGEDLGHVNIFVSYSHKDEVWRSEVEKALGSLPKYFDDKCIEAGEQWLNKIERSIYNASIVVLLMSENFLKSDFIQKKELWMIEKLYKKHKLKIIPILIDGKIDDIEWMAPIQFLKFGNGPMRDANLEQIEEAMEKLKQQVKEVAPNV